MDIGLCTIAFRDRPIDEALDVAVEAGFDGVEIWGQQGHLPPSVSPASATQIRQFVDDRGLKVFAYGSYLRVLSEDYGMQLRPVLNTTAALGAPIVRIWAGATPSAEAGHAQVDEAVGQLRELCHMAAEVGVTVAFENHDGSLADSAEMILHLIERTGADNLKTYYQPSWRSGAGDFYESLERLLPHVVNIHAQNFRGHHKQRTPLADGDADYERIFRILREGQYDGPIEVEFVEGPDPEGWARRDQEYLRSLIAQ